MLLQLSLLYLLTIVYADWVTIDMSSDAQCSADQIQISVMKQTGVCLKTPRTFPIFRSYEISSCSSNEDTLTITVNMYTQSDCTGSSTTYPIDDLPTGCFNGTSISCQETPIAESENWPAVGLYIDEPTCSTPSVVIAAKPDCTSIDLFGYQYSTQISCSENELNIAAYNNTLECDTDPVLQEQLQLDNCAQIPDNFDLPDEPRSDSPIISKFYELIDMGYIDPDPSNYYYYADCGGVDNIPGVLATSGSHSNNDDDVESYGGLGTAGLSVVVVGCILAVVVGTFAVRYVVFGERKRENDINQNILPVGNEYSDS